MQEAGQGKTRVVFLSACLLFAGKLINNVHIAGIKEEEHSRVFALYVAG
jgi:hypothetical protein